MTLTRLLEINLQLIRDEDDRGLQLAERVWRLQGAPSEAQALTDTIERCLRKCTEEGIPYPPILLKRKKQIERGAWLPRTKSDSGSSDSLASEGNPNCPRCNGSGLVLIENGSHATMCECNKWMRSPRLQ